MKTIYETGATSHAVNDLILFTDNTRELAALRNHLYTAQVKQPDTQFTGNFRILLKKAVDQYVKEFPTSHSHITGMNEGQKQEFCELYANDFESWKRENL